MTNDCNENAQPKLRTLFWTLGGVLVSLNCGFGSQVLHATAISHFKTLDLYWTRFMWEQFYQSVPYC